MVQPYSSPFPPTSSSISLLHCDEEVIENMSPPQEETNAEWMENNFLSSVNFIVESDREDDAQRR